MNHWLEFALILLIGVAVVFAITNMRSKTNIDSPVAFSAIESMNQFIDPAAYRAQQILEKKRNLTVAKPAAEGDPIKNGTIEINQKEVDTAKAMPTSADIG